MAVKPDRIIHGDCIAELDKLDAGCADLAFADPPFNIGYAYDEYDDRRGDEDYLGWSKRWMEGVTRVLRPWGAFWLAIGDEYAAELKVMATRELGLICRNWVVWYYTFGVHCNSKFTRSHAHLFYFIKRDEAEEPRSHPSRAGSARKSRKARIKPSRASVADLGRITFNDEAIRVPSARQLVYADKRANPKGRVPDDMWIMPPSADCRLTIDEYRLKDEGDVLDDATPVKSQISSPKSKIDNRQSTIGNGWILRPQDLPDGFSANSDTWYFPRVCGTFKERKGFHGCQMPEQLLGRIIRACSNEGDLVLDPFAGSGTTLAVARKLGRKYLGFEISKDYATETTKRLTKITPGDPLNGAENPLASAPDTANGKIRTPSGKRVRKSRESGSLARESVPQAELWG